VALFIPSLGVMTSAVTQLGDHQPYRVNLQTGPLHRQAALGGKAAAEAIFGSGLGFDYLELHLAFVPRPCSVGLPTETGACLRIR
jgi:hypothetical protein